jgi:hypothetical protein
MSYGVRTRLCLVLFAASLQLAPRANAQSTVLLDPRFIELIFDSHLTHPDQLPAPAWLGPNATPGQLPAPSQFEVLANGEPHAVQRIGATRRAVAADKKLWSAHIQTRVLLELATALPADAEVTVSGPGFVSATPRAPGPPHQPGRSMFPPSGFLPPPSSAPSSPAGSETSATSPSPISPTPPSP